MKELIIYYDKECPFCSKYSELVQLRSYYDVHLVNAREHPEKMKLFLKNKMNINEGFIIEVDNEVLQGDAAVVFLSENMKVRTLLGKFMLSLMKNKYLMYFVYPVVKFVRIVLLFLIGKSHRIKFK